MNSGFNIGSQQAGRDIYNIASDLSTNQKSPPDKILKIIHIIQQKVCELEIDDKRKKEIEKQLESVKVELEYKNPDKNSIGKSIKKTNEILKDAKATSETLDDIGVLLEKVAEWFGTNK